MLQNVSLGERHMDMNRIRICVVSGGKLGLVTRNAEIERPEDRVSSDSDTAYHQFGTLLNTQHFHDFGSYISIPMLHLHLRSRTKKNSAVVLEIVKFTIVTLLSLAEHMPKRSLKYGH